MERDIRQTPLYREIEEHFKKAYEPGFGTITGASGPTPSPDGRTVAFTGARMEKLEGMPSTRVCMIELESGVMEEVTVGPNDDRAPRWSPDGSFLAFLSDRREKGQFQLYLLTAGRIGEALVLIQRQWSYFDRHTLGAHSTLSQNQLNSLHCG